MRAFRTIPLAELREIFTCDAGTGELFWKSSGAKAVPLVLGWGYSGTYIPAFRRAFPTHRLIWALHYGKWPDNQIDHINRIKTDNRIANLRSVTPSENCKNRPLQSNSTSGVPGVNWCKGSKKWVSRIRTHKSSILLGRFRNKSDAIAARKAAEAEHGFHPNYGRAA